MQKSKKSTTCSLQKRNESPAVSQSHLTPAKSAPQLSDAGCMTETRGIYSMRSWEEEETDSRQKQQRKKQSAAPPYRGDSRHGRGGVGGGGVSKAGVVCEMGVVCTQYAYLK